MILEHFETPWEVSGDRINQSSRKDPGEAEPYASQPLTCEIILSPSTSEGMNDSLEVILIVVQRAIVVKMTNILTKVDGTPEGESPRLRPLLDSWLLPTSVVVGYGYNIPWVSGIPPPVLSSFMGRRPGVLRRVYKWLAK